jgi:ATP-dependent helicase HepA
VTSIVPYARGTLEEDLFKIWQEAFQLFEQSMSGMEIVLEDIQDQIIEALERSTHTGLANLLPQMKRTAEQLRSEIEEERYFEEGSVDYRRRAVFTEISNKHRDGERLRKALLGWAEMAGLEHSYDSQMRLVVFDPTRFNVKSIQNAKFARPPDMREALRRSGREHDLVLRGTFDRGLAVRREDLIFFAPGETWTDALLTNALEADRGRCAAVLRYTTELEEDRHILALMYRLSIDPRPLYLAGYHPTHLFRAQGYLEQPTYCLYVSTDGEIITSSSPLVQIIQRPFAKNRDIHLGKRGSQMSDIPPIQSFKRLYSRSKWQAVLDAMFESAEKHMCQELSFMTELAEEARDAFARSASGQRAARRWLTASEDVSRADDIREYESVSDCLVEGIAQPIWQLESACFWILRPGTRDGK